MNNIPKENKSYKNTANNYAEIDNKLSESQKAIGESSNLAQLSLTYTYNFDDKKYYDYVCILSVLAQIAIDSAKRAFKIDFLDEIAKIKKDMNIKQIGYPKFWKHIKDKKSRPTQQKFSTDKINHTLKCPMNYLYDLQFKKTRKLSKTLPMNYFFKKYELKENRRKCKKVEEFIDEFATELINEQFNSNEVDYEYFEQRYDELLDKIRGIYISKDYVGLMSWLIDRTFQISPQIKRNCGVLTPTKNKILLMKTLYNINKKALLKVFSKNLESEE